MNKRLTAGIFAAVLVSLMLVSCGNSRRHEYVKVVPGKGTTVIPDSTEVPAILNPLSAAIRGGYLVTASSDRNGVLTRFRLPSMTDTTSWGRVGNGPDELVSPGASTMAPYGGRELFMMAGLPFTAYITDPEDCNIKTKVYREPRDWGFAQSIVPVRNDTLLAQRGTLPMDWALLDYDGNAVVSLQTDFSSKIKDESKLDEMQRMFLRSSIGNVSPLGDRLIISYRSIGVIFVYDREGTLIREIGIDGDAKPDDLWIVATYPTDDALYISLHDPSDRGLTHSTVISIDWDGMLTGMYEVPKAVGAFCVDTGNRMLYFFGAHDADYVYHFKLSTKD